MSAPTSSLPNGWSSVLESASRRLDESLAQADARLAALVATPIEQRTGPSVLEGNRLDACLQGLNAQLELAESLAREVDAALQTSEQALCQHASACQGVRQRLADWAARAIG